MREGWYPCSDCSRNHADYRAREHRAFLLGVRRRSAALDPVAPGATAGRQAGAAGFRFECGYAPLRNAVAQRRARAAHLHDQPGRAHASPLGEPGPCGERLDFLIAREVPTQVLPYYSPTPTSWCLIPAKAALIPKGSG